MKEQTNVIINIILGILFVAVLTYAVVDRIQNKHGDLDCEDSNMFKTVRCINKYVNIKMDYKISNDSISLNDSYLMRLGGDCKDWTEYYKRKLNYYGFNNTEIVKLPTTKVDGVERGHMFLVVGNEKGYCILDLLNYRCIRYKIK